jgi:2-polyprenyl-3-methyl-5-hydroxy-6-metoxy-1,4-benzoquinol methylase
MPVAKAEPGITTVRSGRFTLRLPRCEKAVAQDQEWFEVEYDGHRRRMRMHDYAGLYRVRGLYEAVVYDRLKCASPPRIVNLLMSVLADWPTDADDLRVLDLGAGNGIVGSELRSAGVREVVGLDLISEAEMAARRDHPRAYRDYVVADLTDLDEDERRRLRADRLNCLVVVAALGFGDIPPEAFAAAMNLIQPEGWLGITIKETFLSPDDDSGFARLLRAMINDRIIDVQAHQRYCHRMSLDGRKLFYYAIVARKLRDVPASLVEDAVEHRRRDALKARDGAGLLLGGVAPDA